MRKMKDSGVEWIGEIPEVWELSKIGAVYDNRNIKVSDTEYAPLSITKQGVVPQLETAAKTDNGYNRKLVKKNDFVINSRSDRRGSCGISELDGSCSLINTVLKPRKNMCNSYYGFAFKSDLFSDEFYRWGHGIVDDLWSTKWSDMKSIYIPMPSINEQERIADYLDEKCSKIDAIIARQEEIIEKLKEYKLSIITEAVTKGLNPDVEMKESGIEWIGKIPDKWCVIKGHRIIQSTQNGMIRRDLDKSDGQIVLKLKNIAENGTISYEEVNKINLVQREIDNYQLFDGDLLFVRVNGSRHLVGKCAIYKDTGEITAYNDHIIRVKLNSFCDPLFFQLYLQSIPGRKEIDLHINTAAGQYTISGEGLRDVYVPLPPIEEQYMICSILTDKCKQIDSVIDRRIVIVKKLKEYKKSHIYEVVTGKREVL